MERNSFDAIAYFYAMASKNKLAIEKGFQPVTISNSDNLEGLFEQYRDYDRFVAISDTNSGNLSSPDGTYGFTKNRAYTVFILSAYEYDNMQSRQEELELCRELFRQFVSKILRDKYLYDEKQMYFDTHAIPNQEIGRYYLSGMTGLHFTLYVQEPIDLRGWADMMVTIWRENILRMGILRTGTLKDSLSYNVSDTNGQISIAHQFMLYGIFVARGTGKGYRRGNSGKDDENGLQFLGKSYRKAHKLGKPRQKREWWFPKYMGSLQVLSEVERSLYGEAYMGTLSNVLSAVFGGETVTASDGSSVTHVLMSY